MQMSLRPEIVFFLRQIAAHAAFQIGHLGGPVILGRIARTATAGLIHDIHRVAAAHEILRPAFAPVRRTQIRGAGAGAAMHHDERIGMRLFGRNAEFDIHLIDDVGMAVHGLRRAADIEKALTRQRVGRIIGRRGGSRHGKNSRKNSKDHRDQKPGDDAAQCRDTRY